MNMKILNNYRIELNEYGDIEICYIWLATG